MQKAGVDARPCSWCCLTLYRLWRVDSIQDRRLDSVVTSAVVLTQMPWYEVILSSAGPSTGPSSNTVTRQSKKIIHASPWSRRPSTWQRAAMILLARSSASSKRL